jgi:hypothetical protein
MIESRRLKTKLLKNNKEFPNCKLDKDNFFQETMPLLEVRKFLIMEKFNIRILKMIHEDF